MPRTPAPTAAASPARAWLWPLVIAAAVAAAYANSLHVPYLLDDVPGISSNPTIRHLGDLGTVLNPPPDTGPSGRPILNLTLALIYAVSGANVLGYHLANVALHAAAALLLYGLLRRLLRLPWAGGRFRGDADSLSGAIALLWAVHPLLTDAVTYMSQIAEVLMSVFYLLTLYALVRGAEPGARPGAWLGLSLAACWLGVMAKEPMMTAPFIAFCLDWAFLSGGAAAALKARGGYFAGLAGSWALLALLMGKFSHHTVGLHVGVSPWTYLLTEARAVAHYLQVAIVPYPLVFDYGVVFVKSPSEVVGQGLLILGLLAATAWALLRGNRLGLAGVWFFVILSPTSSVIPIGQMPIAESRDYLPSLGVVVAAALCAYLRWGARVKGILLGLAGLALVLTVLRNEDYATNLALWTDTVAHAPGNARAHDHLGNAFDAEGRVDAAIAEYAKAAELAPTIGTYVYNIAHEHDVQGKTGLAESEYRKAIELDPTYQPARVNLATLLAKSGDSEAARQQLELSVKLRPKDYEAYYNLGLNLYTAGKVSESIEPFRRSLELKPEAIEPRNALGTALFQLGRTDEALGEYRKALSFDARSAATRVNLGNVLIATGRMAEAKEQFQAALAAAPANSDASTGLGLCLMADGQLNDAAQRFQTSLQENPNDAEAHFRIGNLLAMSGRLDQAIAEWQASLRLRPGNAEAHNNLATAYSQSGKIPEAIAEYQEALKLRPDYQQAKANLDDLLARQGR